LVVGLWVSLSRELLEHLKSNRICGNDTSKYMLYAERNKEQIKCGEYVLLLGTEYFLVFPFNI
jgi:hypothetical protein